MDAAASLPPYAHLNREAVQCIASASVAYGVPELLLHSVLLKENGRPGMCVANRNGTKDCGLAQLNSVWEAELRSKGVPWARVVNDACTSIYLGAYVLKSNFALKREDWFQAVVAYNIGPNSKGANRYAIGHKYASDVVRQWKALQDWVDKHNPAAPSSSFSIKARQQASIEKRAQAPTVAGVTTKTFDAPVEVR